MRSLILACVALVGLSATTVVAAPAEKSVVIQVTDDVERFRFWSAQRCVYNHPLDCVFSIYIPPSTSFTTIVPVKTEHVECRALRLTVSCRQNLPNGKILQMYLPYRVGDNSSLIVDTEDLLIHPSLRSEWEAHVKRQQIAALPPKG